MAVGPGKSRRGLTLPDEVWAVLDTRMLETQQSVAEVLEEILSARPGMVEVRFAALEARFAEREKILQEQGERLHYLVG